MRITPVVTLLFLLGAGIILLGAGPVQYSEENVSGISQGNHELDCTVIRPWRSTSDPADYKYPVIGWANGWDQGNVIGEHTTEGYKPGLIEWALDGPYIVVAANQWSAQESDVLACVQWIKDGNETVGTVSGNTPIPIRFDRCHIRFQPFGEQFLCHVVFVNTFTGGF